MRIELKLRDASHGFESRPGERLLYAGLRSGVPPPYECASGTCGSRKAMVVSAEVEDLWPEAPGRKHLNVEVRSTKAPAPLMATPDGGRGRLVDRRVVARDVIAFAVELDRAIEFHAGQFVGLQFPGIAGYRCYSMVNFAPGHRRLEFVVKRKPGACGERIDAFPAARRDATRPEHQVRQVQLKRDTGGSS